MKNPNGLGTTPRIPSMAEIMERKKEQQWGTVLSFQCYLKDALAALQLRAERSATFRSLFGYLFFVLLFIMIYSFGLNIGESLKLENSLRTAFFDQEFPPEDSTALKACH